MSGGLLAVVMTTKKNYIKVLPPSDILNLVFSLGPFWLEFPPAPPNVNVEPKGVFLVVFVFLLLGPDAPTSIIEIGGWGGHDSTTSIPS